MGCADFANLPVAVMAAALTNYTVELSGHLKEAQREWSVGELDFRGDLTQS